MDLSKRLDEMTVEDVCEAIDNSIEYLNIDYKAVNKSMIKEKNINGRVLAFCDLDELKLELKMSFGDWQLFKNWVLIKRINQSKPVEIPNQMRVTKQEQQEKQASENIKKETRLHLISTIESTDNNNRDKVKSVTVTGNPSKNVLGRRVEFVVTPVIEITTPSSLNSSKEKIETQEVKTSSPNIVSFNPIEKQIKEEIIADPQKSSHSILPEEINVSEFQSLPGIVTSKSSAFDFMTFFD